MIGEIGLFLLGLLVGGLAYSLVLCLLYGIPKSLYWAAKGLVSYRLALSYAGFAVMWAAVLVVAAVCIAIWAPGFQDRLVESRSLAWGRDLSFGLLLVFSLFTSAGRAAIRADFVERASRHPPEVVGSLPLTSAERAKGALRAAKRLIQEAQDRYQRLPLGAVPTYLYATYRDEYGFGADRYEDFCAQLVAASLSRAVSRDDLEREFQRVSRYLDGLLETYGEIGVKWNLPGRFSVARIDQTINDPGERELFKTGLLADSIVSVWAFTVGYHYYKTYGEQPPARESAHQMLTQQEVSERLRSLHAETE